MLKIKQFLSFDANFRDSQKSTFKRQNNNEKQSEKGTQHLFFIHKFKLTRERSFLVYVYLHADDFYDSFFLYRTKNCSKM